MPLGSIFRILSSTTSKLNRSHVSYTYVDRYVLPEHDRIFLDPQNIHRPLPYTHVSHGATKDLLVVNKQIHAEAIDFIFGKNIVNIIRPRKSNIQPFLNLGTLNQGRIRTLEMHVDHSLLKGLGRMWKALNNCGNLVTLRLVFYHEHNWYTAFADLAEYVVSQDQNLVLDLELYTSIVAPGWYTEQRNEYVHLHECLMEAASVRAVYSPKVPKPVRHIVVTASATPTGAYNLWLSSRSEDLQWGFKKLKLHQSPTPMTSLRWTRKTSGGDDESWFEDEEEPAEEVDDDSNSEDDREDEGEDDDREI